MSGLGLASVGLASAKPEGYAVSVEGTDCYKHHLTAFEEYYLTIKKPFFTSDAWFKEITKNAWLEALKTNSRGEA